jgi:hypothetical protein
MRIKYSFESLIYRRLSNHTKPLLIPFKFFRQDRLCGLVVRVPGYRSKDPGFDSRRYQIFWEVVGLERVPLSLVRIIEELLEWKSRGSGLESRKTGDPLRSPRDTLYPKMLALTSPTCGSRSVGIVRLRTKSHGVLPSVRKKQLENSWTDFH